MSEIIQALQEHWALEPTAARAAAEQIVEHPEQTKQIERSIMGLSDTAIAQRNGNRQEVAAVFNGTSDKKLLVMGPCSLDADTDVQPVFDAIKQIQAENEDALVVMRANMAKPRSASGWKGLWYSTNQSDREAMFNVYSAAVGQGIPVICEITETPQVAALAPFLSGMWLGARDVTSTSLRGMASAFQLPIGLKNSVDGNPDSIRQAMQMIRSGTNDNHGSGVDLTRLAATADHPGIALNVVPVGAGNTAVGIFARGEIMPDSLNDAEKRVRGLQHLGELCLLATQEHSAVIVDVSHDVVHTFGSNRKDQQRSEIAINGLLDALAAGEITDQHKIAGMITEIGPNIGKTDPNWILNAESTAFLSSAVRRLIGVRP